MSKNKKDQRAKSCDEAGLKLSAIHSLLDEPKQKGFKGWIKTHLIGIGIVVFALLLSLGVMAKNGWLPHTDGQSGKRTGWLGKEIAKNAPSSWNPIPMPTTVVQQPPQVSKEYVYAGSRLVSSVASGATEIPPADLAFWRPSNGNWYIYGQTTQPHWGQSGDIPVQGDYDGDGKTDFSVFRPSDTPPTWYISNSSGSTSNPVFGNSTDIPVVADYDGDGKTDVAVWRPSTLSFYIRPSTAPSTMITIHSANWSSGDVPAPADYDGDGKADGGIFRPSTHTFYSINSTDGQTKNATVGSSTDTNTPVCADYDGDGKADFAVFTSESVWMIRSSASSTTSSTQWGDDNDIPVPNDYDGDGKVDMAVWRVLTTTGHPAIWYINQSSDLEHPRTEYWGAQGDIPVPSYYRR